MAGLQKHYLKIFLGVKKEDLQPHQAEVIEDNAALCYTPGKRGFYSPVQGKATAERLNGFRNVGRLMGLCLLQNELCPLFLNRHVIKFLLGRKVRFHDLAFFDPVIYESLRQLVVDAENKVHHIILEFCFFFLCFWDFFNVLGPKMDIVLFFLTSIFF
jgi:hypothetical protein